MFRGSQSKNQMDKHEDAEDALFFRDLQTPTQMTQTVYVRSMQVTRTTYERALPDLSVKPAPLGNGQVVPPQTLDQLLHLWVLWRISLFEAVRFSQNRIVYAEVGSIIQTVDENQLEYKRCIRRILALLKLIESAWNEPVTGTGVGPFHSRLFSGFQQERDELLIKAVGAPVSDKTLLTYKERQDKLQYELGQFAYYNTKMQLPFGGGGFVKKPGNNTHFSKQSYIFSNVNAEKNLLYVRCYLKALEITKQDFIAKELAFLLM